MLKRPAFVTLLACVLAISSACGPAARRVFPQLVGRVGDTAIRKPAMLKVLPLNKTGILSPRTAFQGIPTTLSKSKAVGAKLGSVLLRQSLGVTSESQLQSNCEPADATLASFQMQRAAVSRITT